MTDRTQHPPPQPSPARLQPNRIMSEPATVDACRGDYEAGAVERRSSEERHPGTKGGGRS